MNKKMKGTCRRMFAAMLAAIMLVGLAVPGTETHAETQGSTAELVNVALGKTVTTELASETPGELDTELNASYLVDGDWDTYWNAGYDPVSATIDLGMDFEIQKFVAVPWFDWWAKYTISVSTNGTDFTEVVSNTDETPTPNTGIIHELTETVRARYVKITFTESSQKDGAGSINAGRSVFAVKEFEVYAPLRNVALGKNVTLDLSDEAAHLETAENASALVDGDYDTYVNGAYNPASATIDLGQAYNIQKFVAVPFDNGSLWYKYTIFISTDGTNFTEVVSETDETVDVPGGNTHVLSEPMLARYIKITVTESNLIMNNAGDTGAAVRELEVYALSAVEEVEPEFTVNKAALKMPVGKDTTLEGSAFDNWGKDIDEFTYTSNDASIATVDANGLVTAIACGTTTITVACPALEKTIDVSVKVYDPAEEEAEIKITVFWPPSAQNTNAEQYDYIADANFNRVLGNFSDLNYTSLIKTISQLCAEREMEFIAGDGRFWGPDLSDETLNAVISDYEYLDGLGGFMLRDEPSVGTETSFALMHKKIKTAWPEIDVHMNFLPYYVYPSGDKYQEYLGDYAMIVDDELDYLMFDIYPYIGTNTFNGSGLFTNLNLVRELGLEYDVKTATFIQSVGTASGMRRPTATEISYEVAVALAYGYKQLAYFTYCTPEGQAESFTSAIIGTDGKPTDLYEPVKEINRQVMNLSPTLINLDAVEVYHSGQLDGQEAVPADFFAQ
ncbi:MAG: discoidin domain-containing protein, partial [Roseburia sp.]|nr:discoidin domain-containing protein [Roseburia sp.]